MRFMIVVPEGVWTQWESANLRGSPAAHIVLEDNPEKTLCGRNPDNWMMERSGNIELANCKQCLRAFRKRRLG